jgi:queuine/archaeosine tRNA-ribosyltransferase
MERLSNRIRAAIMAGHWSTARQLLDDLAGEVENAWKQSATDDERRTLEREVFRTLEWARTAVMASRAQDHHQLLEVSRGRAYSRVDRELANLGFEA